MGLLERVIEKLGRDLDSRVSGSGGVARFSYRGLRDERALWVRATIEGGGHGRVVLQARAESRGVVQERRAEGQDLVESELAPAGDYRESPITVQADIVATKSGAELAVLCVRIWQRESDQPPVTQPPTTPPTQLELQTYSVESRFDEGRAQLQVTVDLS